MRKIVTLIVLAICAVAIFSGCSQGTYAPCGYESLTGCWVREYEDNVENYRPSAYIGEKIDAKCCECIQFFFDGKLIKGYATEVQEHCKSDFGEYYTEKSGIIRINEKLFHYNLTDKTFTLTNADETREYKLWDKDINYLKELCPFD